MLDGLAFIRSGTKKRLRRSDPSCIPVGFCLILALVVQAQGPGSEVRDQNGGAEHGKPLHKMYLLHLGRCGAMAVQK